MGCYETMPLETSPLLSEPLPQNGLLGDESNVENGRKKHPMADKMHILLPAIGVGVYLVAVDQLLAVATYAKIGSELNALNNTSWIATAYFLTLTSFQPLYGKLSDIFGRKACLLFAYAVFGIGCLGCGLAQSMTQLCIARAVAGIGGGGMSSVVSILFSDIVPLQERGVWQGYLNVVYAAGTSTGGPLGGLFADSLGWRWSFMIQAPLCLVAWISVYLILDLEPPSKDQHWVAKVRQIDFLGALTLVLAVVSLLTGLDSGPNLGWSHPVTVVSLSLTPFLLALFLLVEMRIAKHPFAPGHIILSRDLLPCYMVNMCGMAGEMGVMFFVPLYFQAVEGLSATASGSMLVPATIAGVLASLAGGWVIKRTGRFYWPTVASYGLLFLSMIPLVVSVWFRSLFGVNAGFVLSAVGNGGGITTILIALLANAAAQDSAVAIACSYLFRSLGSSVGVGISSAVLQQVLRQQLSSRIGDDGQVEEKVRQSLDAIRELPPLVAEQVRSSYRVATMASFAPSLCFGLVCFLATFWVKEKSLER
ncbi:MFS general substrate transporter [Trichoderma citrinoviride]|uniref:MFS general substrate transporter n=1 Tax=Trichoderma citrinoviride TaxID=58853 RepID=A0A2T4BDQ3_9HYPO|nr:MFS general substrate transporter [Trichoderma citrinoviride]PTB67454.1 MFS general substrate transporter [Trichoderma citrinoviride]